MYVEVNEWYATVCHMTKSKVNVSVKEVWKMQKWPISKSILHQYACNQKTNGELWNSKTVSKF